MRSFGAVGDGTTDDTTAIQAAITAANAAGGGTVVFPKGTFAVTALTHGTTAPIRLLGMGSLATGNGVSTIKRLSGSAALLTCTGTSSTIRSRISIENMTFDGNGVAGTGVRLIRCNDVQLVQSRFRNTTGCALWATELWNSNVTNCYFTDSGTTTTSPAVLLDDFSGGLGASVVVFTACEWENNGGIELRVSGPNGTPGEVVSLLGGKMERNTSLGSYVFVDLAYAQTSRLIGLHFGATGTSGNPHFVDQATTGSGYPNVVQGCTFSHSGAAPTYFIDHQVGGMVVSGNSMVSSTAPTAFYRVGVAVGAGGAVAGGNYVNHPTVLYLDERTADTLQPILPAYSGWKLLTYSASITPNCNEALTFDILATNTIAYTINNPTNPKIGTQVVFDIINISGGVMGAITWGSEFGLAGAFTNPANNKKRTITFLRKNASQWVEVSRAAADI